MVQGGTSAAMDEPNWIFYDELERVAAADRICPRQKTTPVYSRVSRLAHLAFLDSLVSKRSLPLSFSAPTRAKPHSPVHPKP
jgi:hypothetical protein